MKNKKINITLLCLWLVPFVFTFCLPSLFVFNVHAQERSLSFQNERKTVVVEENIAFSLVIEPLEEATITVDCPPQFQIDQTLQQQNADSIDNIEWNENRHQLVFSMKNQKEHTELQIMGSFTEAGDYTFKALRDLETAELTLTVEEPLDTSTENELPAELETEEIPTEVETEEQQIIEETATTSSETEAPEKSKEATDADKSALEDRTIVKQPRAGIPVFDWRLLNNDGLDLSTFTKVDKNTPVKLTGGLFDHQERNYYLFLGHFEGNYTYDVAKFQTKNDMYRTMSSSTLDYRPILSPAILGVKKQSGSISTKVVDYSYADARSNLFDIGQMSQPSGPIEASGYISSTGISSYMVEQYVKNNELVAYGFLIRNVSGTSTTATPQPVRIHGYVSDYNSGRVRYDVSYYNPEISAKYYALTYGLHIDIGGAHMSSKLFSNGDKGLYFNQDIVPADSIGEILYFHMKNYQGANGPTSYKVGNIDAISNVGYWSNLSKNRYWLGNSLSGAANPYEPWDAWQREGYEFPLNHPMFVLRWDPIKVAAGGVGVGSFDISIEELAEIMPAAEMAYTNLSKSDGKNHLGDQLQIELTALNSVRAAGNWSNVTIKNTIPEGLTVDANSFNLLIAGGFKIPLPASVYDEKTRTVAYNVGILGPNTAVKIVFNAKISGKAGTTITSKMSAGNGSPYETREAEIAIPVETEPINFQVIQQVLHEDGTDALSAKKGERLIYRATLKNPFEPGASARKYKTLQMNLKKLDANLENVSDIKLVTEDGSPIPGAFTFYEPTLNQVIGIFDSTAQASINALQDISLEYTVTVKKDVPTGTEIIGQAEAWALLDSGEELPLTASNEVRTKIGGALVFVSAPQQLSFGQNLKIEAKDKNYSIQMKDDDLIIQDFRGPGSQWTLTTLLTKELTSAANNQLKNSLYYIIDGKEQLLTPGISVPVINQKTLNDQAVNVSAQWDGKKNGPLLKVPAGKAHADTYTASIQWTLQNVPANTD